MGRPSDYTQEVADAICLRLSKGEPLAHICLDDGMPAVRTVSDWKASHAQFSADFARAREDGYDRIAADCLQIADTPVEGVETVVKANGDEEVRTGDMLGHRKLQIETRLKLLAKWDKRYGDKMQQEHTGADGGPIKTESTVTISAEEAYKRMLGG